jgi:hypothetical protein
MDRNFHFYMPIDITKSFSSNEEEPWVFEGIASTADVDLFGEVVYPESFSQTIEFFKSNGKIYFDHDYAKKGDNWLEKYGFSKDEILSLKTPIGKPLDAQITPEGLYIKGILNKSHPMARKMWEEFLTNKDTAFADQIGLSIGAKYLGSPRREYDVKKGKYITYLPELLLYEVSMTPEPVNPFTKTWASVLKSMMSEDEKKQEIQYHTIAPDSVLFDQENDRLVIKSTVQGGDGTTHVFESYVNVKEEIRNAMAEDVKVVLKAAPPVEEEEAQAVAPEAPVEEGPPVEAAGPEAPFAGEEGEAGEEAMPEEMAEVGAADAEEEGAGGLLDSLVASEEGQEVDAMAGDGDASVQMLLDKVDTLIDLVMQLTDSAQTSDMVEEAPLEEQVTTQPPATEIIKSVIQDSLDSLTVSLSEESATQFGEALKSIFQSGFSDMEERIADGIVRRLSEESTLVTKSVTSSKESPRIVHPGASVTGEEGSELASVNVIKAVSDDGEERQYDRTVLKSFTEKYRSIIGHTGAHAQQRARIVEEAQKTLNLSEPEFKHFVKMADKGKL